MSFYEEGFAVGFVYLDNSSTTSVHPQAAQKALDMMIRDFGNPGSLHRLGFEAERELAAARSSVGALLGADASTLIFTSGGTEANNLAIFGSVAAHPHDGKHIVTTAVEHSSVREAVDQLEKQGYEVTRLLPDAHGDVSDAAIVNACRPDTALVAVMLVNNETGARFRLEDAVEEIRQRAPHAHIHADAVQAAGKIPLRAERWGFDTLSASAHKIHGAKGCGVLYLRKGVRVLPRVMGGKQEKGLRGGTECTPLIAAFGVAASLLPPFSEQNAHYSTLRRRLLDAFHSDPRVAFHLPQDGVPYIVSLSVPGLRSETMIHFLAERDVYVSGGSACSRGAKSAVLTAMGLSDGEIDSALRVSMDFENTVEDIDRFSAALREAMNNLARKG